MAPNPFAFKGILFVLLTSCRLNKRNEAWGLAVCPDPCQPEARDVCGLPDVTSGDYA